MIVLVDPVSTGTSLSSALIERGQRPLHLYSPHLGEYFAADPHELKMLSLNVSDSVAWLKSLEVTAVIAASEWGVTAANQLAHGLGLPHHVNSLVAARRDKAAMNRAMLDAGLPAARTVSVSPGDDVEQVMAGFTFPVIVKPVDSAGGDGCFLCHNPADVTTAVRNGLRQRNMLGFDNSAMLIQDYLDGPQFIVNTVSIGGRHLVSDVHRVRIDRIGGRSILRHTMLMTTLDDTADELVQFTLRCLDAVGICEGAAHTEVRMTSNGPRLIEVNARIMGASLKPSLYRAALGYNQADLVAERFTEPESFTRRFDCPYAPAATLAMVWLYVAAPGTVSASPGLDHLRALPGFHSMDKMPAVGAAITEPWLCTGQAGMAYFLHEDCDVVTASLARLHRLEDGGGLHSIDPFDVAVEVRRRTPAPADAPSPAGR